MVRLASRTFDDEYLAPPDAAPFVLAGGGRRIELSVGPGYRFAQVYAPADDDVVAFEPMTAPTNALVAGGPDLPLVAPGGRYEAIFSITVDGSRLGAEPGLGDAIGRLVAPQRGEHVVGDQRAIASRARVVAEPMWGSRTQ